MSPLPNRPARTFRCDQVSDRLEGALQTGGVPPLGSGKEGTDGEPNQQSGSGPPGHSGCKLSRWIPRNEPKSLRCLEGHLSSGTTSSSYKTQMLYKMRQGGRTATDTVAPA